MYHSACCWMLTKKQRSCKGIKQEITKMTNQKRIQQRLQVFLKSLYAVSDDEIEREAPESDFSCFKY